MYAIYRIVNKYNGKSYVGSTNNYLKRVQAHFNRAKHGTHSNRRFQKDYDRYGGKDAFEHYLLCKTDNEETKFRYEDIFIKGFASEYNILPNAGTQRGREYTGATLMKMSEAAKRRGNSPEQLERFRKINVGRKQSDEEKRKRSETHKRLHAEGKINSFKKVPDTTAYDIMCAAGKGFDRRVMSEMLDIPLSTLNAIASGVTRKRIYREYQKTLRGA